MNEWWTSGGCTISMYSGTSRTTAGTKSVASRSALMTFASFGRSTESANPPVVATTIWDAHEPNAITIVFQKYRPTWTVDQASRRLLHAVPCGKSAIGFVIVSIVGVIADFASQRIGPSP